MRNYQARREASICVECTTPIADGKARCPVCRAERVLLRNNQKVRKKNSSIDAGIMLPPMPRDKRIWGCDCPFLYKCANCDEIYAENQFVTVDAMNLRCPKGHEMRIDGDFPIFPVMCIHDIAKEEVTLA